MPDAFQTVPGIRITCMAHHALAARLTDVAGELNLAGGWIETARVVRQRIGLRHPRLPVRDIQIDDAPMDTIHVTVPPSVADRVASALIEAGDLQTPGRGQILLQDVKVCVRTDEIPEPEAMAAERTATAGLMRGMVLLTCIASQAGSGELLARIALKLGAGLPVVSRGIGTGIRDRLGLLRITIPPEKEIVRLVLPAHDADGIERLLVEEARLDRPGGGFLYQTGVRACRLDPLLRIGRQGHAASMEQIIAALDDLKGGTAWRKHVAGFGESPTAWSKRVLNHFHELVFCCADGHSEGLVADALAVGAGGATIAPGRTLRPGEREGQAVETVMLCVPDALLDAVLNAIHAAAASRDERALRCEIMPACGVFSYQSR